MSNNNEDYIDKVLNSEEYMQNKMQINTLKTVLLKEYSVPEKLVDWLITSAENNAISITEAKYKK